MCVYVHKSFRFCCTDDLFVNILKLFRNQRLSGVRYVSGSLSTKAMKQFSWLSFAEWDGIFHLHKCDNGGGDCDGGGCLQHVGNSVVWGGGVRYKNKNDWRRLCVRNSKQLHYCYCYYYMFVSKEFPVECENAWNDRSE